MENADSVVLWRHDNDITPNNEDDIDGVEQDLFQSSSLGCLLREAHVLVSSELSSALRDLNLRPAQFKALSVIAARPGLSQSDVSAAIGVQRTNFVAFADELERRGLIERTRMPGNRRAYALRLTQTGNSVYQAASITFERCESSLERRLGPGGRQQLSELLGRLTAA